MQLEARLCLCLQPKSEEGKELGLDQTWILLRKVAEKSDYPYEEGRTIPVVHFMLWEEPQLPKDDADLELASWFRTTSITSRRDGRMTYRYLLDLTSQKSVETYGMIYLGNVSGTGTPKDEVSTQRAGLTPCITLTNLEHELCALYRHFDVAPFPYLQPFDAPVCEGGGATGRYRNKASWRGLRNAKQKIPFDNYMKTTTASSLAPKIQ